MPPLPPPRVRLRPLDLEQDVAIASRWYEDPEVLHYSEGEGTAPYDDDRIRAMYAYLGEEAGEVFIVEASGEQGWIPIGDAVLRRDTLPIVIGHPRFRSRGVGTVVLAQLVERARARGWSDLLVRKVFAYNERSLRMYRSAGFVEASRSTDDAGRLTVQLRLDLSLGSPPGPANRVSDETGSGMRSR